MIYGRRFFERQRSLRFQKPSEKRYVWVSHPAYKNFQSKYTWYIVASLVGSLALFLLPTWYFISQNYEIFDSLSLKAAPHLMEHLERETQWLAFFFIFSLAAASVMCWWISQKITRQIIGPLWGIENHMKRVTLGDWSSTDFYLRKSDDLQNLAEVYSYLYRTLRNQNEADLKELEKALTFEQSRESQAILTRLIEQKRQQLYSEPARLSDASVTSVAPRNQRHAS